MRIHVEAGFTLDSAGGLLRVNEPGGADAPRFFLGRTAEGNQWWFRHDLGIDLVEALEAICRNEPVPDDLAQPPQGSTEYSRLLDEQAPIQNSWTGPAYRFPDEVPSHSDTVLVTQIDAAVLRPHFEEWLEDPPSCQPFVALLRDGVAVSVCCSVRITSAAHEAGVETPADFRGRGYAAQAVAAWARAVRHTGRIPLYSTSWENTASQAVARKLGLVQFGADLHIT